MNIRGAEVGDLEAITEIYNEAIRTSTATFDTEPKTRDEQVLWFESHGATHPILVADLDGTIAGWSCVSKWSDRCAYSETVEVSFYVEQGHRGQGIGKKLMQAIIEEARRLGFHSLIAQITEGSEQSIYFCKSMGYVHAGTLKEVGRKFDHLLDVHILQKVLD